MQNSATDQDKCYRIVTKSKLDGKVLAGEVLFSKSVADGICRLLNDVSDMYFHGVEKVEVEREI